MSRNTPNMDIFERGVVSFVGATVGLWLIVWMGKASGSFHPKATVWIFIIYLRNFLSAFLGLGISFLILEAVLDHRKEIKLQQKLAEKKDRADFEASVRDKCQKLLKIEEEKQKILEKEIEDLRRSLNHAERLLVEIERKRSRSVEDATASTLASF
jgi:uncharacterized membrane protein YgaE (UPF0421/DUF939 family)